MPASRALLRVLALTVLLGVAAYAAETPTSSGPASVLDTPVFRIPLAQKPPTIDGVMEEREWEDASALSSFWYDYSQADFRFLAPVETQLQVYSCYDKENLYFAYSSPVYPPGSWLIARGRFPDVVGHPLYGLQWDDHIELELRPYYDNVKGFRMGLFKWFANPIGTYTDQYWSMQGGEGRAWQSKARIQSKVAGTRWVLEIAVPLKEMVCGEYKGKDAQGAETVKLPPPPGTAYRCWFTRAIGGNGPFFNAFDAHIWNTTKTKLIFDPECVSFQVNELGPIMEDVVDVQLTVKNHNSRSETVQLGFFVESAAGTVYSSYQDEQLKDGLIELVPGEVRKLRLKKPFPGITQDGNVLWFDVRSAGKPAKPIFQTRLVNFHAQGLPGFKERRIDVIAGLRPPRRDFDFRFNYCAYTNRLSGVVDTGIHGASDDARRAAEAKLTVMDANNGDKVVATEKAAFHGAFACFLFDLPKLVDGHTYKVSVLLFDGNKRIVGEDNSGMFTRRASPWMNNRIGLDDVVWEPFTPIEKVADGLDTLKHRITIAESGLPAQIYVRHDVRELPLELRKPDVKPSDVELLAVGRGPQLRAPIRLEIQAQGQRAEAKVVKKASPTREWKSEIEYASKLKVGPLDVNLVTQYDCDGAMTARMTYGADKPVEVESFEMVMDVAGLVDMAFCSSGMEGMASADKWECTLPPYEGVVWDSANSERPELYYTHFIPWMFLGSGDRAFTWFCDSDRGWVLDRDGSVITLERNKARDVTVRIRFINHKAQVQGRRSIEFTLLTHPAKPKPTDFRKIAWHYRGDTWASGYAVEPIELAEDYLKARWHEASGAPADLPYEKAATWRKENAPWVRYGRWRNVGVCPELDREWEDKAVHFLEQQIRIGRRHGWWWDEYWPVSRSENLAAGNAYLRDPADVRENELPWQSCFLTGYMRNTQKRLARVFKVNNVPQRSFHWANNSATCYESFAWDCQLVEEAGSDHRSFDLDNVTIYPNSLFKFLSHNFTGLVTRIVPRDAWANNVISSPGDDKRLDRQLLGRALLNDIGAQLAGPHGSIQHNEQSVRLLKALTDFGYFEDQGTEFLPYWRNGAFVRYGEAFGDDAFSLSQENPAARVYVSVFRRPFELNGRKGCKAMLVIMNECDEAVRQRLYIFSPEHVFGGPNRLAANEIIGRYDLSGVPDDSDWSKSRIMGKGKDYIGLMDMEDLGPVRQSTAKGQAGEIYGPVFVPRHDYRILYGYSVPEK